MKSGNKKKILIIGVNGLLGHVLFNYLYHTKEFIVYGSVKNKDKINFLKNYFKNVSTISTFDIYRINDLNQILSDINPDYVINCASLSRTNTKKYREVDYKLFYFNFPKSLYELSIKHAFTLVNISSDGVFSGSRGNYDENDIPDSKDFYGIYKALAETISPDILTLRTSIIGHELKDKLGLLEWIINSRESVNGFSKVLYSGLTTLELSKIIASIISSPIKFRGLFNLSGPLISKYQLLSIINKIYNLKLQINIDNSIVLDRTLNDRYIRDNLQLTKKSWYTMISEMKRKPHGIKI